ncbi:MAG: DUF2807 domain-containing protein [Bacteroidia bacterium]|nr:DUF2807 domain-containing protein [Bacteroidia bacterium]
MKLFRLFVLFLSVLFFVQLFSGCAEENMCDCIKRTGTIINESRALAPFNRVLTEDNLNVYISHDSVQEVIVEAGENIVPLIETDVVNGTLIIRNKNRCNWTRSYDKPLNVYLKMPVIQYIINNGTAPIKSKNIISCDSIDIQTMSSGDIDLLLNVNKINSRIFGSGDVILTGYANEHSCDIGGTAYLYCKNLTTSYTYIHTYTIGPSEIKTTNTMVAKIDGKGDVFCYGNPVNAEVLKNGPGNLYYK